MLKRCLGYVSPVAGLLSKAHLAMLRDMYRRFVKGLATAVGAIWLATASLASGHGDEHAAIVDLTQRIAEMPGEARWPFERAGLYSRHGDFALALSDLAKAEALDKEMDAVKALRAQVLFKTGKPQEARILQAAYLQKHPQDEQVRIDLSEALAAVGEVDAALREMDAVLEAAENPSPDVVARRIELTEQQAEDGPSRALEWLVNHMKSHPLPVFEETALRLEIQLGKIPEALHRMDRLIAAAARPAVWRVRKAELLVARGRTSEARECALGALEALDRLPEPLRSTEASGLLRMRIGKILTQVNP